MIVKTHFLLFTGKQEEERQSEGMVLVFVDFVSVAELLVSDNECSGFNFMKLANFVLL